MKFSEALKLAQSGNLDKSSELWLLVCERNITVEDHVKGMAPFLRMNGYTSKSFNHRLSQCKMPK